MLFKKLRAKIGLLLVALLRTRYGVVIFYGDERKKDLDFVEKVRKETRMLLSDHEAYQLMMAVRRTKKIKGDIAEVGTYRGASSKLIAEARGKNGKSIYLFDTFSGLPDIGEDDAKKFHKNQYRAAADEVAAYLAAYPDVHIYPGLFPQTSVPIENKTFSFVHLDVDLYQGSKDSLEFFYPRMNPGGVIILHDYMTAEGVKKAVDEFMENKPEAVLESSWSQCLIVKI